MDFSKYTKLIDKVARKLNNGSLKQEELSLFLEKELGVRTQDKKGNIELDLKKENEEQNFILEYRLLNSIFFKIWNAIFEIEKRPEPFTIKHNSNVLAALFEDIKKYKKDDNYERVVLNAITRYKVSYPQNKLTKEHIIVLKRKYM
jgi:hypothetical protein